jgi:thiol-disulfide isomerase/thioredoxin
MLPFTLFDAALPYAEFLTQFGNEKDRSRWDAVRESVVLADDQKRLLAAFTRRTNVLVLAGAWCGDCANNCPIFERFAEAAPVLSIRYLDRDAFPDAQAELRINGGNRVPVAVFFSEDGQELARYGERTLADYRRMISSVTRELGPEQTAATPEQHRAAVEADWLREFLRVQCVLRLSPRLRKLHGD